jgi:hypothetical protein
MPQIISPGVTFPILAPAGTAAAPSYSFAGDTGTGIYETAGVLRFAASGSAIGVLSAGALVVNALTIDVTNQDILLVRDGAGIFAQKNGANAQTFRVYGTTTGPKYIALYHDGSNGNLDTATSSGTLRLGASNATFVEFSTHGRPTGDNAVNFGSASNRWVNIVANNFQVFAAASDANAAALLQQGALGTGGDLQLGPGGAGALDLHYGRSVNSGLSVFILKSTGSLTGASTDTNYLNLNTSGLGGAFTITRFNYILCQNPGGAPTVTDATAIQFDAAVGTHKALAASAAVAVTLGSTGPAGSTAGGPQGWIKWNINGTLRFTPFW